MEIRGRGSDFPRLPIPSSFLGHPPKRPSKQPPIAKVLSSLRFSRNSLAKYAPDALACLVTARNISLSILIPTRALALQNCELRNVLSAIWRHVVHFNIDRHVWSVVFRRNFDTSVTPPYIPTFHDDNLRNFTGIINFNKISLYNKFLQIL